MSATSEKNFYSLGINETAPGIPGGRQRFIKGIMTGEFRKPKKGEWYLSGAVPEAYQAPKDMPFPYYILYLVETNIAIKVLRVL